MASLTVGAPQPWPPPPTSSSSLSSSSNNKSYRDCTQPICSFNCPQFCSYFIFPPPPPFPDDDDSPGDGSSRISPLMAALIAVLAAAFIILFYYTVVSKLCLRRRRRRRTLSLNPSFDDSETRIGDHMVQDPTRSTTSSGLDESFINQITVFKYRRGDGLIDGIDCAVCLSEFKEEENLRLMPNCEHAFHIPCIDTWLRSHSNCPLCRATMNPATNSGGGSGGGVRVSAMQIQRGNDAVLVIREVESEGQGEGELIVCHEVSDSEEREKCTRSDILVLQP